MVTVTKKSSAGRYELPDLVTLEPAGGRAASLSEKAYYLLRDELVTLAIPPGTTIDEPQLQQQIGVGRTPIREALRRLAHEGLITVKPYRGMYASHVDLSDLRAVSEVRVELEARAGYLAAQRADDRDITQIDDLLTELYCRKGIATSRELMQLDQRIHRLVYRTTHNAYLSATLQEYYIHSLRMWFLLLGHIPHIDDAVSEHLELLAAVHDGDAETAGELLRRHVIAFDTQLRTALWHRDD